jgi:large subunit ribosomal protein L10
MALNRSRKEEIVADMATVVNRAQSLVLSEYRGLSVAAMTELRKQGREKGIAVRVVKNSLARLAAKGSSFEDFSERFQGPLLYVFSFDHPGSATRLVNDFARENDQLKPLAAMSEGAVFEGVDDLKRLASLPTREGAIGLFAGGLKAPLAAFAGCLGQLPGGLARSLEAVRQLKAT